MPCSLCSNRTKGHKICTRLLESPWNLERRGRNSKFEQWEKIDAKLIASSILSPAPTTRNQDLHANSICRIDDAQRYFNLTPWEITTWRESSIPYKRGGGEYDCNNEEAESAIFALYKCDYASLPTSHFPRVNSLPSQSHRRSNNSLLRRKLSCEVMISTAFSLEWIPYPK